LLATAGLAIAISSHAAATPTTNTHTVTYDHYSLMIDGKRRFIYSGEFHPFRLPSPDLWPDILQKMKAAGFNTVCIYLDWGYHSPAPGVYDFDGVRNMDTFLDAATDAGLYVIVRPGPYINAETDSGGFPGWLTTIKGRARSTASDYLADAMEWFSHIDPIIARHQLTNGTGTIIACQVENEYYTNTTDGQTYMQDLENKLVADGITVPLTGNHNATFVTGLGATNLVGFDNYPQGFDASQPTVWNGVPDYYEGLHASLPSDKPLYLAEFQGGSFDPWGGAGTANLYTLTGPDFENVFYKSLIAEGVTMLNLYMTYGGTNWGWLPEPGVYTSYDYGAAINEQRQLTGKYTEEKLIASFTQAVPQLTKTQAITTDPPTDPVLRLEGRANPDDKTVVLMLRHADGRSSTTEQTHIAVNLSPSFGYTYDDTSSALVYSGNWSHVANQSYTGGDYQNTESFSNTAGDSVSISFTGLAIRWIGSTTNNHGIASVYLDGNLAATVDAYSANQVFQVVLYKATDLANGPHTLKIVVTGTRNPASQGAYIAIDAIDLTQPAANSYYPSVPQQANTAITVNGRDAKLLLANYRFGSRYLIYSTSQLMTDVSYNGADFALFYDNQGNNGETVFRYPSAPDVEVVKGDVTSTYDAGKGGSAAELHAQWVGGGHHYQQRQDSLFIPGRYSNCGHIRGKSFRSCARPYEHWRSLRRTPRVVSARIP
jgi:Glycosyl hydrolases family 35/Beta-galactosidase, domain 2